MRDFEIALAAECVGGRVGGAERRWAHQMEATAAPQAGDGGAWAQGMAEELQRNGWTLEICGRLK